MGGACCRYVALISRMNSNLSMVAITSILVRTFETGANNPAATADLDGPHLG